MKKVSSILLALALIFSLAACAGSQEEPQPAPEVPENASDPAEQVKLIAENRDLWLSTDPQQADLTQYAVADMDENGRLELISTVMEGTGRFSTTRFYEVSEDFSKLEPVEYDLDGAQSEADLGWTGSFRSYKGELGNFVVASDQMANGYAENYYYEDFFVLRDGVVNAGTISYCLVLAEDSNGDGEPELHAYYYASGDEEEELTPEAFARSADDFFGYAYDRYVMDLSWKQFDEAARKSEVDVPAGLADSWSGFGFRKSTQEFESLFVAPSSYYDELYENGEKAAITYGMESLPDYWTLQEISTELEARNAIEDGIDCHMIIGQDGMVSFSFNDPTDARSPIELEGMPLAMAEDGMGAPAEGEESEGSGADWMVVFSTEDGLNRFEATIGPDDGRLYVTWYWWSEEDPGADPVIEKMVFTNGVG
ncbi:MAG: hypothetical protein K5772_02550 [Clostridia bacterium]|nr:hypothetical protein [Clostridia bacterium]